MNEIKYRVPIYIQLREILRSKIENGEISPGTTIPSENDLAKTYKINRLTVRNAVDELVNEGLLKRVQGKGVYVVGNKIERDLENLGGFSQTMRKKNRKPSIKIIAKYLRKAGTKYSQIFDINSDDNIYYIRRICYADTQAFSLEEIFIPEYFVPKLEEIDLQVFSLYDIYDFYNIKLKRAWQTLEIAHLEKSDARMLGISNNLAVFLFESTSHDENNKVVEFARTYTRGDKCEFTVHFGNYNE